ncbi:MAG: regulatory protein RecX [Halomonadaceae bacterium]|nr:MAG: regulatory protein RecX [Halomonadaceae bacterium]
MTRREHSRQELYFKLVQRGFVSADIEPVLERLQQQGWLNDERFAEIFVRHRVEQGYGPMRILADLQQRGVHWRPQALADISEEQWQAWALEQQQRRFPVAVKRSWQELGKQGRFLSRRGFTRSQIDYALQAADD